MFRDWRFTGLDWMVATVIAAEILFAIFVWSYGPLAPIPMSGAGRLVHWGDRTQAAFLLGRSAIFAAFVFSIGKTAELRGLTTAFGPHVEVLKMLALVPAMSSVPVLSALASAWS